MITLPRYNKFKSPLNTIVHWKKSTPVDSIQIPLELLSYPLLKTLLL